MCMTMLKARTLSKGNEFLWEMWGLGFSQWLTRDQGVHSTVEPHSFARVMECGRPCRFFMVIEVTSREHGFALYETDESGTPLSGWVNGHIAPRKHTLAVDTLADVLPTLAEKGV